MNTKFNRWTSPVLGAEADSLYIDIYGDEGKDFIRILENSPYEIAVISRLIAYLGKVRGGKI